MLKLFLFLLGALCSLMAGVSAQEEANKRVVIQLTCPPVFTRGFPAIIRLKAKGPTDVPVTDLFTGHQNLSVKLTAEDGKAYSIRSTFGAFIDNRRTEGTNRSGTPVPEGSELTMLLELYSVSTERYRGFELQDVPNGKYTMQVIYHYSEKMTPPQQIEIKPPSPGQLQFLGNLRQRFLEMIHFTEPKDWVEKNVWHWAGFLQNPVHMLDLLSNMDIETRQLMGFHALLSEVVLSSIPLEDKDDALLERLNHIEVPSYLEIDKQCLLLELKIIKGQKEQIQPQIDALIRQDKGLTLRIDNAKIGLPKYRYFNTRVATK